MFTYSSVENLSALYKEVANPAVGEAIYDIASANEIKESIQVDASTETELHSTTERFSGWYFLEPPARMSDVNLLLISKDIDDGNGKDGEDGSYAGVFTIFDKHAEGGFVEPAWIEIVNEKVRFRTKKINGFEFEFNGEFFKGRAMGDEGEVLLRGTLTQYRKNKKVAQATGNFSYSEPKCWH